MRKYLMYGLYALSIILLIASIYLGNKEGDIHILFWLGLMVSSVAMMVQEAEKKEKNSK